MQALELYSRALKFNPADTRAMNNMGAIYTIQHNDDLAYESLMKSLHLNPTSVETLTNLASLHSVTLPSTLHIRTCSAHYASDARLLCSSCPRQRTLSSQRSTTTARMRRSGMTRCSSARRRCCRSSSRLCRPCGQIVHASRPPLTSCCGLASSVCRRACVCRSSAALMSGPLRRCCQA
jgi:hypothetical protein